MQDDVGEHGQRRSEVGLEDVEANLRGLAAGRPGERGSEIAELVLDLQRRPGPRPPIDRPHRHAGDALFAGGIGEPAGARDDRQRHLGQIAPLDDEELQAVLELRGLYLRRLERPVGSGLRFRGAVDHSATLLRPRRLRAEAQDDALVGVEPPGGHVPDRRDTHVTIARDVPFELRGITKVGVVLVEQVGLAAEPADPLETGD